MLRTVPLALVLLAVAGPSHAVNVAGGKTLTDKHCYQCHGNEVYTRSDRKVRSIDALHRQVQRCELALGLKWFDDDIANVSAYLNQEFYKFK
jgi:cytochrome c553